MAGTLRRPKDPVLLAVPVFFGCMGIEHLRLGKRPVGLGANAGDYERPDTITSLTMGAASVVVPLLLPRLLRPFALGRGRFAKALAVGAAATVAASVVADRVDHANGDKEHVADAGAGPRRNGSPSGLARRVASGTGVAAIVASGVVLSATWASLTSPERLWRRRGRSPARSTGPLAMAGAVAGWDFLYYWNHRLGHQSRYLWAVHVVHHSSERYNFATALRQPVLDEFGPCLPYGLLCLFGTTPEAVAVARAVNLLYQFWIHTETIGHLGRLEQVLNSPSHHRVHHGSNSQYIDRNYGSILIVWDRLFGTYEPEDEQVKYGLTTNLNTYNPVRVVLHEHAEMLRGVARSTRWSERLAYVLRGPGWAYRHAAER